MLYQTFGCCIRPLDVVSDLGCCIRSLDVVSDIWMLYQTFGCCIRPLDVVSDLWIVTLSSTDDSTKKNRAVFEPVTERSKTMSP